MRTTALLAFSVLLIGFRTAAPLELNVGATNSIEDDPEIFLTEADRKWLKAMDCAFSRKVDHA